MKLSELKELVDAALLVGDMECMVDYENMTEAEIVLAIEDFPAYFNVMAR
jgi:hypothetical protein